jgi:hypothetical protein
MAQQPHREYAPASHHSEHQKQAHGEDPPAYRYLGERVKDYGLRNRRQADGLKDADIEYRALPNHPQVIEIEHEKEALHNHHNQEYLQPPTLL